MSVQTGTLNVALNRKDNNGQKKTFDDQIYITSQATLVEGRYLTCKGDMGWSATDYASAPANVTNLKLELEGVLVYESNPSASSGTLSYTKSFKFRKASTGLFYPVLTATGTVGDPPPYSAHTGSVTLSTYDDTVTECVVWLNSSYTGDLFTPSSDYSGTQSILLLIDSPSIATLDLTINYDLTTEVTFSGTAIDFYITENGNDHLISSVAVPTPGDDPSGTINWTWNIGSFTNFALKVKSNNNDPSTRWGFNSLSMSGTTTAAPTPPAVLNLSVLSQEIFVKYLGK